MPRTPLDPDRRRRLRELYAAALDLPRAQRSAFSTEACGGDPALLRELQSLLDQTPEDDDGFLATPLLSAASDLPSIFPPADAGAEMDLPPDPDWIGPYRILGRLGAGGMGVVYRAEQTEPLHRDVAVKVIKPGMDTERVVTRFANERQALARMDHPGIARIHDAGTTDEGRPWFAMQLVDGQPIDAFCRDQDLPLRERLALFCRVCDAVQHAHQKGVIHRDLKPSNILARRTEGQTEVTVIDFGIARAVADSADEARGRETLQHEILGTHDYMAPEQATPLEAARDVDSRADVYSLGVLLYQLLTDQLPFRDIAPADLHARTPTAPSARTDASTREGRELRRSLRDGLDWIVVRALEPDRARRYPTASELAAEVRRYLADEPILAGPPGFGYRFRSFTRRHRTGVAAAGLALLGIVGGSAAAVLGLVDARAQRQRAEAAAELMIDWLAAVNLETAPQETRETLDEAARRIGSLLAGRPRAEASARRALGQAYFDLAADAEASEQLGAALRLLRSLPDASLLEQYEALYLYRWVTAGQNREQLADVLAYETRCAALYLFQADHPGISQRLLRFLQRSSQPDGGAAFEELARYARANLHPEDPRWLALADMICDDSYKAAPDVDAGAWLDVADDIYASRLRIAASNMRRLGIEWARLLPIRKAARSESSGLHGDTATADPRPDRERRRRFLADCDAVVARFRLRWPEHHWYTLAMREERAYALELLGRIREAADERLEIASLHRRRGFAGAPIRIRNLQRLIGLLENLQAADELPSMRAEALEQIAMCQRSLLSNVLTALRHSHPVLCETLERLYRGTGWPSSNPLLWNDAQDPLKLQDLQPLLVEALALWKREFRVGSVEAAVVASGMTGFVQNWSNLQGTGRRPPELILPWLDHHVACLEAVDSPLLEEALFWRALTHRRLGALDAARIDATRGLEACRRDDRMTFSGQHYRLIAECMLEADPPDRDGGLKVLREAYETLQQNAGKTNINTQTLFGLLVEQLAADGAHDAANRVMRERLRELLRIGAGVGQLWNTTNLTCHYPWTDAENHALALRAAEAAARIDPDHASSYTSLAHAAYRTGNLDRALNAARTALEMKPDRPGLRAIEALCLQARGEGSAAQLALREADRLVEGRDELPPLVDEARAALR